MRSNLPPEELELGDALERIFPAYCWKDAKPPRRTWKAGRRPEWADHSDNIDKMIEAGINNRTAAKGGNFRIKSQDDLEKAGISCPYYHARLGVAFCVEAAKKSVHSYSNRKEVEAVYQKNFSDDAEDIASSIKKFLDKHIAGEVALRTATTSAYAQPVRHTHPYERLKIIEGVFDCLREGAEGLRKLGEDAKSERRSYVKQGARDVWRLAFVSGIGRLWVELMGEQPSANTAFIDFLKASYNLVGGERDEWKRSVNTFLESRIPDFMADNDRFVIPDEMALLSEIMNDQSLNHEHSVMLKDCLDDYTRSEEIYDLLRENVLPKAVSSIVLRMPWSLEERLSSWQGVPSPLVKDFLLRARSEET